MLFIEFLGVPGSGKSTMANAVVAELQNSGLRVQLEYKDALTNKARLLRVIRKIGMISLLVIRSPRTIIQLAALVNGSRQSGFTEFRLVQHLAYLASLHHYWEKKCDILVFHQGYTQSVYSMAYSSKVDSAQIIATLYPKTIKADMYICTLTNTETIKTRLNSRVIAGSRIEGDPTLIDEKVKWSESIISYILTQIENEQRLLYRYEHTDCSELDQDSRVISKWVLEHRNEIV